VSKALRFLGDMGVSQSVIDWLRTKRYDASHLREEGLQRLPNGQIFEKAGAEERIVLTFDLDFGEIVAMSGGKVISVVLFRLNNTSSEFVIKRLETVLNDAEEALKSGAIVTVEEARHRIRRLPLGS